MTRLIDHFESSYHQGLWANYRLENPRSLVHLENSKSFDLVRFLDYLGVPNSNHLLDDIHRLYKSPFSHKYHVPSTDRLLVGTIPINTIGEVILSTVEKGS
jgi:hypothetical protein